MKKVLAGAAAVALVGALFGCADTQSGSGTEGEVGQARVALVGGLAEGTMATIVIRNVFDHTESFLVQCQEKDHTLNGDTFCDELIVLPPGVYEIIVQSSDPNCRAEFEWYKVIVEPNETVEIEIVLVCGQANGGLDVIVRQNEQPTIEEITFCFWIVNPNEPGGGHLECPANKFMCVEGDQVNIRARLSDGEDCEDLTATWYLDGVLAPTGPVIATGVDPNDPCVVGVLVDPSLATKGDYDLTLKVTDGELTGQLTFPLHFLVCADGGAPLPNP